jgi:hypothetical protein
MSRGFTTRLRRIGLWACLAVFVLRVLGQFEVLLAAPAWLPSFEAWSSGIIPYSMLLPIQVLLIAWMAVIASDQSRGNNLPWDGDPRRRTALRRFAALYAATMLLRLLITWATAPHTVWDRGLIPILAHWDLALFIFLVASKPMRYAACIEPDPVLDESPSPARPG